MPRKLTIDLGALERRYHELSRMIHPDRFASSAAGVRDASLRATATLTAATARCAIPSPAVFTGSN